MELCPVANRPLAVGIAVIGIGQLRSDTCHYVERAAAGESFDLVWRRRAVARLSAFDAAHDHCAAPVALNVLRTRAATLVSRVVAGESLAIEHLGGAVAALRPLEHVARDRPRRLDPEFGPGPLRVDA